ncbi:sporulation and spore germination [Oxobacter pfennigii]|uniref:Sporulation and spore germination n=1 Tax=Oxobacter pfennigii TaxID=36849 RepID=A0A0N8NSS5_9CLOT|nr:GerMN domain-containing protein [Oxobacter pfennigii]KPU42848.1 sporulation and spore germination [Oxobacter pfennigii]
MRKFSNVIVITLCIAMVFLLSSCSMFKKNTEKKEMQIKNAYLPSESNVDVVEFELYFGSPDLKSTKAETRSVKRDELLGAVLLNEFIKGPAIKSSLKPLLPEDTKVLSFSIRDGVGYINFSGDILNKIDVTEEQEKSIVEGIVKTMCQLSEIKKVQLMFDNEKKDTLSGSVDISGPLSPSNFK